MEREVSAFCAHPHRRPDRYPRYPDHCRYRRRFCAWSMACVESWVFLCWTIPRRALKLRPSEAVINAYRDLLQEDELVIVSGRLQPGRIRGLRLRFIVQQVMDLADSALPVWHAICTWSVGDKLPDRPDAAEQHPCKNETIRAWRVATARTAGAPGCSVHGSAGGLAGTGRECYLSDACTAPYRTECSPGSPVPGQAGAMGVPGLPMRLTGL